MKKRGFFIRGCIAAGIFMALGILAWQADREPAGKTEAAVERQEEGENVRDGYFLPYGYSEMPFMKIKEGSGYITGVVLVHQGRPYALTEEEYKNIIHGGEAERDRDALLEEFLAQRKAGYAEECTEK